MKLLFGLNIFLVSFSFSQDHVMIRDPYLFMASTEVTNQQYNQFLNEVIKQDHILYKCYLPDSTKWKTVMGDAEDYIIYYHKHPAYLEYPAVNITYESAVAYCNWLTNKLNASDSTRIVKVRLPNKKEWEYAARGGAYGLYPWEGNLPWIENGQNKGKMRANFKRGKGDYMGIAGNLNDGADITAKVGSYWPNGIGLYDMAGNVEEMINEEGITKGGSWKDRFEELQVSSEQFVAGPSPEVGFRYIIEVVKIKQNLDYTIDLNEKFFNSQFKKINDSSYGGKYEITNQIFNQFLKDTRQIKNDSAWSGLFQYESYYRYNYSTLEEFLEYPVVNVTKELANAFCEWLTQKYRGKKNIKFRLPTEAEWIEMSRFKHSNFPWKSNSIRNKKGEYRANYCPKRNEGFFGQDVVYLDKINKFSDLEDYDGYGVLAPVNSFNANQRGFYNLAGNVSELLLDKDYTKGGSWGSTEIQLHVNSHETYDLPSPFVGFRIVAVYLD
jgi:sulfatase modifying factor 1